MSFETKESVFTEIVETHINGNKADSLTYFKELSDLQRLQFAYHFMKWNEGAYCGGQREAALAIVERYVDVQEHG